MRGAFAADRSALVGYLMAGYPDEATSLKALAVMADAGVDLIELGVPYTDPLADGPTIRDAAEKARAAAGGAFGIGETIALVAKFRAERPDGPPVALMTYLNPLMRFGLPKVAAAMREAGVGGVIVPDLPPEMARPWLAAAGEELDTVFLVAPTSTDERLQKVGGMSRGFLYCVSTTGVTGERTELPAELAALVDRVRQHTSLPVAVGFGISTPEQAAAVARIADGVVVGSAFVRRQANLADLASFARDLADAVHEARQPTASS